MNGDIKSSGGIKDQREKLPGIGGVPAPYPCAKIHLTENQTPEDSGIWPITQVVQGRVIEKRRKPR